MTSKISKDIYLIKNWTVCLEFKAQDLWIGAYWDFSSASHRHIWICFIPCLPLDFEQF